MASLRTVTGGTADYLKAFVTLKCPTSRHESPHVQRRLLAHWPGHRKGSWHILVRCSSCGLEYVWYTDTLPVTQLQPFLIRLHAAAFLPGTEVLPDLVEEFSVLAVDRQAAYRQAQFGSEMPVAGQVVVTYVDNEEERDARF
ncbi:hypothetical protein [Hymenobacter lapidiphilus]|uniref:DUF1062 domain-containing protein n=1 Tax=Hymenobacter lapidiphilus TaxID=2608003 RepID=A0A7Y7PS89_9BACT|nr:hypothetical protein [Hymenobacter lapidiphilus]NVO33100.1 hypothetical protein [Hymenobacter lapidiphilus]